MTEERNRQQTYSRLQAVSKSGHVVLVTQAFGPNGENLIDHKGPLFSGEPGVKLHVKQGNLEEDVVLSPYFGDTAKFSTLPFVEGEKCILTIPGTDISLPQLPLTSKDGSSFFAIYLTDGLKNGSLVAINDVWGNHTSKMLDEMEYMTLLMETEEDE